MRWSLLSCLDALTIFLIPQAIAIMLGKLLPLCLLAAAGECPPPPVQVL